MRNHILGFPDELGRGPSTLLYGTENGFDTNQRIFCEMRAGVTDYPKGIARIELHTDDQGCLLVGTQRPGKSQESFTKGKHGMKKIISLIAFAAFLIGAMSVSAQLPIPTYVQQDYTVGSAFKRIFEGVSTTNVFNYSTTIDVRKTKEISFVGNFKRSALGTNVPIYFVGSVDGLNWPTNLLSTGGNNATIFTWVIQGGNTADAYTEGMTVSTNFNVGGIGYLKCASVGPNWDGDSVCTNSWIKYSYKISAP